MGRTREQHGSVPGFQRAKELNARREGDRVAINTGERRVSGGRQYGDCVNKPTAAAAKACLDQPQRGRVEQVWSYFPPDAAPLPSDGASIEFKSVMVRQ